MREGVQASHTTLRRFVAHELGHRWREATVRLPDPPPGEEAQVDFGRMGWIPDEAGRLNKLHVLVATLSFRRYQFVWPRYRQTTEELCAGLETAGRFFDCVVKRVVPDNASSMVVRASPTEPELNRTSREYADARGLFVHPARVRSPQDMARVENQVPYVRERWFAGEQLDFIKSSRSLCQLEGASISWAHIALLCRRVDENGAWEVGFRGGAPTSRLPTRCPVPRKRERTGRSFETPSN